jgi:hypothetical protein
VLAIARRAVASTTGWSAMTAQLPVQRRAHWESASSRCDDLKTWISGRCRCVRAASACSSGMLRSVPGPSAAHAAQRGQRECKRKPRLLPPSPVCTAEVTLDSAAWRSAWQVVAALRAVLLLRCLLDSSSPGAYVWQVQQMGADWSAAGCMLGGGGAWRATACTTSRFQGPASLCHL